jgi:ribosomal protein L40E
MEKRIKEVEKAFVKLKGKFRRGKISRQKFVDGLRKLRFKDDEGRFWMIGARSGKWYFFDGKDWIESDPTSITDKKIICRYCGFANRAEAETCTHCGGNLRKKGKLPVPRKEKEEEKWKERYISSYEDKKRANFVLRRLSPFSFFLFLGAVGLLLGIFIGAFIGATNYFSGIVKLLPSFIKENKGNLLGGLIYAGLGGVLGFIVFGFLGYCNALFVNVVSSFVGGIKVDIERLREK